MVPTARDGAAPLAEGSGARTVNGVSHDSPTYDGSTVTGIGRAKALRIWYEAPTAYREQHGVRGGRRGLKGGQRQPRPALPRTARRPERFAPGAAGAFGVTA
ncbi:hypothetical protein ACWDLL_14880 [Streptomyces griseoincarnatus]